MNHRVGETGGPPGLGGRLLRVMLRVCLPGSILLVPGCFLPAITLKDVAAEFRTLRE